MLRNTIKCSQCNKTFPGGYEYRMHWEKHLDEFLKKEKQCGTMKTPLQELFEYESDLTHMFDSDVRVAGAILEYIRTNKKDMLKKEKELK